MAAGDSTTPDGKLIIGLMPPDLPESIKKRLPQAELDKWKKERLEFQKQFTLLLRGGR